MIPSTGVSIHKTPSAPANGNPEFNHVRIQQFQNAIRIPFPPLEADMRILLMKTLYSFRNIDISDGRRAADGQHAIDAIFHVPGFDGSHFHQPENLFGTLVKSKPRLCQGEAA